MRVIRVAFVTDSHWDETSRWDECVRIHNWIAEDIERRGVDLILHGGDLYERKSTPTERYAVARWVQRLAELAPVIIARGNHDAIGDLPLLERLKARHPIHVCEGAQVFHESGIAVGVLAWPQRSHIHNLVGENGGHQAVEQAAADALRNVLRGLGQELAEHDGAQILLAHAMVRASRVSTGQPLVGCDFEIGLEDLALANADAYLLGHIHDGVDNEWTIGPAPCLYGGSPRRTAFGELESKSYVILECRGSSATFERIATPCTPMVLVEGRWTTHHPHSDDCYTLQTRVPGDAELGKDWCIGGMPGWGGWLNGAEVRLRYTVDSDRRDAAKHAAAEWERIAVEYGKALHVKIEEEVRPEQRARAPEVATAATFREKMEAFWTAKGFDPGDRRESLLAKLVQIEEEVHADAAA